MKSPLLRPDWRHVDKIALDDLRAEDWALLDGQRAVYYGEEQARQVLRMLRAQEHDASFGYLVNNYRHCLQSATQAMRAGEDEETIVVSLLHDVGFVVCPDMHPEFAAALLGAYISERNHWMLRRHAIFQLHHIHGLPGADRDERERWRGHPHFEWSARWVERYDQAATDPDYECAPLEAFEPMVKRVFARPPRPQPLEDR